MINELGENLDKEIEKSTQPDLVVDIIRHGQAQYSDAEYEAGDLSGQLTSKGIEQTQIAASELAENISQDELVVIWSSPKGRAGQSAEILAQVLKEKGLNVFQKTVKREYLRDIKSTKDGVNVLLEDFKEKYGEEYDLWMKYWEETENLPEDVETSQQVRQRLQDKIFILEKLAHFSNVVGGKRLHLIIVTHEEVAQGLLSVGFDTTLAAGTGLKNAEMLRVNIFKSDSDTPARLNLEFRGQTSGLNFDPTTKQLSKVT